MFIFVRYDGVVNQLLSKMDGVESINNILIIGMTNRRELLDPALLRPGRFEVQLEIGLPDRHGREQIFIIHTKNLREARMLAPDVSVAQLAEDSPGFTGAEIAGVVKSASSFAIQRQLIGADPYSSQAMDTSNLVVTASDFTKAIAEVEPKFGVESVRLKSLRGKELLMYSDQVRDTVTRAVRIVRAAAEVAKPSVLSILVSGPRGSGTSAFAAHLALASGFTHAAVLTPSDLLTSNNRVARMNNAFSEAFSSKQAIIVLDDLEGLLEYLPHNSAMSHQAAYALNVLLGRTPPPTCNLVIVATSHHTDAIAKSGLVDRFQSHVFISRIFFILFFSQLFFYFILFFILSLRLSSRCRPPRI